MAKRLLARLITGAASLKEKYRRWNTRLRKYYSPLPMALIATGAYVFLALIMLFLPPYLGVGNDSAAENKMRKYGLDYIEETDGDEEDQAAGNEYFTRVYEKVYTDESENSTQAVLVKAAIGLDNLFTGDNLFDVRFLALLYFLLAVPGFFLTVKGALEQVSYFIEGAVLAAAGVLIFADVSYISYLNSLYVDALEYILMLYIAGAGMCLRKKTRFERGYLAVFAAAGAGLAFCSRRNAVSGIILGIFCFLLVRVFEENRNRILLTAAGILLVAVSMYSLFADNEEFSETDKVHAMTRGVLLESTDPVETLEEFGIAASYSILTDNSLYEYYPISETDNPLLSEGFLDHYDTGSLALYYLRHPGSILALWDMGVQAGFSIARDYCGNYEKDTGHAAMGKSIFWSGWSIFKERSAPKTLGYLAVLAICVFAMTGRKGFGKKKLERSAFLYLVLVLTLLCVGLGDLSAVILRSGDAALSQYNMMIGICTDLATYCVLAELLHKLNVLADPETAE